MPPKLPVLSGDEAIHAFERLDYQVVRQRGSHVRLHHRSDKTKPPLTIPRHRVLGKGLLRKLLRDAKLPLERFLEFL